MTLPGPPRRFGHFSPNRPNSIQIDQLRPNSTKLDQNRSNSTFCQAVLPVLQQWASTEPGADAARLPAAQLRPALEALFVELQASSPPISAERPLGRKINFRQLGRKSGFNFGERGNGSGPEIWQHLRQTNGAKLQRSGNHSCTVARRKQDARHDHTSAGIKTLRSSSRADTMRTRTAGGRKQRTKRSGWR